MTVAFLLALTCVFPRGSASDPGVVAPLVPQGKPVAFWWNDDAFHVGERAYSWQELKAEPKDGATFTLALGEYDREPIVLRATLDSRSHKLRVAEIGPIGDCSVEARASVTAGFDDKLRFGVYVQGQSPDYLTVARQQDVKKGAAADFSIGGHSSLSGRAEIIITGGTAPKDDGGAATDDLGIGGKNASLNRTLYSAVSSYRAAGLLFDYQYVETDREKKVMHVWSKNWSKEAPGRYSIRVTANDLKTDTIGIWRKSQPLRPLFNAKEDSAFDVSDLPAGFYWMHVDYLDAAGKTVHSDRFRYMKPAEKMPWEGTTLGAEDTVPPPWTEPAFGADGVFSCWNRTFRLGGKGLVTSLCNGGEEMLTEPVSVIYNGEPLAFDVALRDKKLSEATYVLTARTAPVAVEARCEFDGYVRFALRYGKGTKDLRWRVSLDRRHLVAFDDGRGTDTQDLIADGKRLARDFSLLDCRWWWTGGAKGLCGGINTLRGLRVRNYPTSGRVTADDASLVVTSTLVDTPYDGEETRTVAFYLEPTPMKPKNRDISTMPPENIVGWTGHLCEHFETKYPGFAVEEKFRKFAEKMKGGKRVFWYNASHALSPDDPFFGWYGSDWMKAASPADYAHEVPLPKYSQTKNGRWQYACLNSKSYFEAKLWGVNWYFNEPVPEAKDLYFDVCNPGPCNNAYPCHACRFKDDFGRLVNDGDLDATREFHKRVYRLVKAKNPDGALYGHLTRARKPADAFFDYCCMGEFLAWRVRWQDSYYDIFTPEFMQALFVPRSADMLVGIAAQFRRWRECWSPDLLKSYNPKEPKLHRAICHFAAYGVIHDLMLETTGEVETTVNRFLKKLGRDRKAWRYYEAKGRPRVSLSNPGPRQLWALVSGNNRALLVLLNDTDETVEQTVSVSGIAAKARDLIANGPKTIDFTPGSCTFTLGPREARFLVFD